MKILNYLIIIICFLLNLILAKPFEDEKSYSDENKLNCMETNDASDYERSNQNPFSSLYKPRSRLETSERYFDRPLDYGKKRSTDEIYNFGGSPLQKRQVGVVYKEDRPIGILQPFQRSYRFIPVKEENDFGVNAKSEEIADSLANIDEIEKREIGSFNSPLIDESYPSILANFKIGTKLDRKRNYNSLSGNYESLTDDNVRDLKSTIRRLRASNSINNEKIEEELKNILDDMGLIDDEEMHGEKREITSEDSEMSDERQKRDETSDMNSNNKIERYEETQNEVKNDLYANGINKRQENELLERQKRDKAEKDDLVERLKDSGNLMLTGNESPLAVSSEIVTRDIHKNNEDYERSVEKQIQSKIDSLKEEVKREIEALNKNDDDDEDEEKRRKRQVYDNLISEETEDLNPAMNPDADMKPLIRKRRKVSLDVLSKKRRRRRSEKSSVRSSNDKNVRDTHEENEKDLLGGDDIDGETVVKRQAALNSNENPKYWRNFRSGTLLHDYLYNNHFYGNPVRLKRQNFFQNKLNRLGSSRWKSRFRRRINDNSLNGNRAQQLSDMSDLDLFGALPKSYDGELSRYKRVKKR